MNTDNKKQYSDPARIVIGLFGVASAMAFISQVFIIIDEKNFNYLLLTPSVGFIAYVFCYTAYVGQAPKWFDDQSFFKKTDSNN